MTALSTELSDDGRALKYFGPSRRRRRPSRTGRKRPDGAEEADRTGDDDQHSAKGTPQWTT
ncbi:hypothetical protein SALBM135S_08058 [Streptomyces alboniger]